jgi:Ran-binding protein 3
LGKPIGSSFATPGATGITGLSSKPAKPFGAPADSDDEDEGSGAEDEEKETTVADEEKKDRRFFEQQGKSDTRSPCLAMADILGIVETGEEGEENLYTGRAKLYAFVKNTEGKGEWKERGVGSFKVNASEDPDSGKLKARFVMRADGSHRVVLNSPLQKALKIGNPKGEKPENGLCLFQAFIDGTLQLVQIKVRPLAISVGAKLTHPSDEAGQRQTALGLRQGGSRRIGGFRTE